jgi:hypothetical protein
VTFNWPGFWYLVVCTALAAYFSLAIVIAIGGGFDVRKMLRRLNEAHQRESGGDGA